MKESNKDKLAGTGKQVAGKVKEKAGQAAGDRDLEREGRGDQVEGKIRQKTGEIKKVFGA